MRPWLHFIPLLLTASALAHVPDRKLVSQLDDLHQTLAASYRYDPYGNTTYSSGSLAAANVYRFSSKEVHLNSGLYSYGYRFYSPNWQRWLNQDPIGEWGGINLYGFVLNDPLIYFDPYGLAKWGQFWRGVGYSAGGFAAVLGGAALSEVGIGIPMVVSGAISLQYGLGNMVAAFSSDKDTAKKMEELPSNLGAAVGRTIGECVGDERDARVLQHGLGAAEGMINSVNALWKIESISTSAPEILETLKGATEAAEQLNEGVNYEYEHSPWDD